MIHGFAPRRLRLLGVLFSHLLLPAWFVILLSTTAQQDTSTWLLVLFAAAAHVAYISVTGNWSWFGIYVQRALPVIIAAAAVLTRPRFIVVNDSPTSAELRLLSLALGFYFLIGLTLALLGRRCRKPALNLAFPLTEGRYMIGQGGSTRAVNRHGRDRSQRYAVDIVKVGEYGIRALGIYPLSLKKFEIFSQHVLSPCDGVCVAAVDNIPDQIPSQRDRKHPAGNYVVLESQGNTVYLMHLMKGSVTVEPGKKVRLGQILGRVGNSGNSTEPHLHIHAEQGAYSGKFSGQPGMPIRFGGRFLVRNDFVDAGE